MFGVEIRRKQKKKKEKKDQGHGQDRDQDQENESIIEEADREYVAIMILNHQYGNVKHVPSKTNKMTIYVQCVFAIRENAWNTLSSLNHNKIEAGQSK